MTTYYTLADYARLSASPLQAGVVDILRASSPLMEAMTFADNGTLDIEFIRQKTLPSVSARKIGASWTNVKGTTDSVSDHIINLGNKIDIDKLLVRSKSIVDQRALQTEMFVKAMALKFNNVIFTGTPTSDYDDLVGFWYRLTNDSPASQTIAGGGLDVSGDSGALAVSQVKLINYIHELLSVMTDGTADWLVMNRHMKLRLEAALRSNSMLDSTKDSYDRTFATFGAGGPKILDVGITDPTDLTALILTNVETDAGALTGGDATSIYALKFGKQYFDGFQVYSMETNDFGLIEDGVLYRTVIDWPLGVYQVDPFALGRLKGIVAA